MRLILLSELSRVEPGLFRSDKAVRAMIDRGELVKGEHWFQQKHRGRIRLDLDAVVELFTRPRVKPPVDGGKWRVVGKTSALERAGGLRGRDGRHD